MDLSSVSRAFKEFFGGTCWTRPPSVVLEALKAGGEGGGGGGGDGDDCEPNTKEIEFWRQSAPSFERPEAPIVALPFHVASIVSCAITTQRAPFLPTTELVPASVRLQIRKNASMNNRVVAQQRRVRAAVQEREMD